MSGEFPFMPEPMAPAAPAAPMRTNRGNDGRSFQKEIEASVAAYREQGIASLEKADPPVVVIWPFDPVTKMKKQRVIFKKNPWLDFVGVWTSRNGRALFVEAKSTSSHRLPINRHGGLTDEQVTALFRWRRAGAAVCVVWRFEDNVVVFTPEMLQAATVAGAKSLVFEEGLPASVIAGVVRKWDFLPVLETAIWGEKKSGE